MIEVSAKDGKTGKEAAVNYEFGETLEASVKLFTEEVVHSQFISAATVKLQAVMRTTLKAGGDVTKAVADWKLGVKRAKVARVVTKEEALDVFKNMDDKGKKEFLAKLKAA